MKKTKNDFKVLASLPHAELVEYKNNKKVLYHFGTITEEMKGVARTSCTVFKDEIESASFNGSIDLQYLISQIRNRIN